MQINITDENLRNGPNVGVSNGEKTIEINADMTKSIKDIIMYLFENDFINLFILMKCKRKYSNIIAMAIISPRPIYIGKYLGPLWYIGDTDIHQHILSLKLFVKKYSPPNTIINHGKNTLKPNCNKWTFSRYMDIDAINNNPITDTVGLFLFNKLDLYIIT